jgi:hypothetical protein
MPLMTEASYFPTNVPKQPAGPPVRAVEKGFLVLIGSENQFANSK